MPVRALLIFVLLGLGSFNAIAELKPKWELGGGLAVVDYPDYRGSDERNTYVLPVPYFVYRSERLRIDRRSARHRLFETDRWKLDLSAHGSVPVDSDSNDAREGMDDLPLTIEVGPELKLDLRNEASEPYRLRLHLPLRAVINTDLEHVGWIAHPQLRLSIYDPFQAVGWNLGLRAGVLFGDAGYHDYFYAVDPEFALPDRPSYAAEGGYAGLQCLGTLSKRFGRHWVGGFVKWDSLHGAAFEDSPLVRRRSHATAGIAATFVFKVSETLVDTRGLNPDSGPDSEE